MVDEKNIHDDDLTLNSNVCESRREFLVAAKKWSKAVVAGAIFGSILLHDDDADAAGWANRRGGGRGAWRNGGGAAWRNGGAWGNGGEWGNGGRIWANR